MEFNQKLQELRKMKGLTQEELAQKLYVTRTAVSKWELGKGYPGIDSLKAIAKVFSVTVDELLSGEELLIAAEEDKRSQRKQISNLVFGLLDISFVMLLFLPFFRSGQGNNLTVSSLIEPPDVPLYLLIPYYLIIICTVLCGIAFLALQSFEVKTWNKCNVWLSFSLGTAGVLLYIISLQPYASALSFVLLFIKFATALKFK